MWARFIESILNISTEWKNAALRLWRKQRIQHEPYRMNFYDGIELNWIVIGFRGIFFHIFSIFRSIKKLAIPLWRETFAREQNKKMEQSKNTGSHKWKSIIKMLTVDIEGVHNSVLFLSYTTHTTHVDVFVTFKEADWHGTYADAAYRLMCWRHKQLAGWSSVPIRKFLTTISPLCHSLISRAISASFPAHVAIFKNSANVHKNDQSHSAKWPSLETPYWFSTALWLFSIALIKLLNNAPRKYKRPIEHFSTTITQNECGKRKAYINVFILAGKLRMCIMCLARLGELIYSELWSLLFVLLFATHALLLLIRHKQSAICILYANNITNMRAKVWLNGVRGFLHCRTNRVWLGMWNEVPVNGCRLKCVFLADGQKLKERREREREHDLTYICKGYCR